MTATASLIDSAKERMGLTSDYQLAKALDWPISTMSNYRQGRRAMDLEQVIAFSLKTGIPLEDVANTALQDRARLKAKKTGSPVQANLRLGAAA